jgi:hypothetical protein
MTIGVTWMRGASQVAGLVSSYCSVEFEQLRKSVVEQLVAKVRDGDMSNSMCSAVSVEWDMGAESSMGKSELAPSSWNGIAREPRSRTPASPVQSLWSSHHIFGCSIHCLLSFTSFLPDQPPGPPPTPWAFFVHET